jgi:hypothetical protein
VTKEEVLAAAPVSQSKPAGLVESEPHQVFPPEAPTKAFDREMYMDLLKEIKEKYSEATAEGLRMSIVSWKGFSGSTPEQMTALYAAFTKASGEPLKPPRKKAEATPAALVLALPLPAVAVNQTTASEEDKALDEKILQSTSVREAANVLLEAGVVDVPTIVTRIKALQPRIVALQRTSATSLKERVVAAVEIFIR